MKEFMISRNEENQRLDKYLKKLLPNASTGFLYKMIRKKNITLNGKKVEGKELLKTGDQVKLFFSDETFEKFHADTKNLQSEFEELSKLPMRGLQIVYEDENILIADKPADMLSQKANPTDISANEYLLGYLIRTDALTFENYQTFHPSVCNRLDRNTTGLLLMGKTLLGAQQLSELLRTRALEKYYLAVVAGRMEKGDSLTGYLIKNEATNEVRIFTELPQSTEDNTVSRIRTDYRPLAWRDDLTLLEVHLITGKTHQIRAHLASIGHPVIGDPKYGNLRANQKYLPKFHVRHQLLHAYKLVFPDGREVISFPHFANEKGIVMGKE